MRPVELGHQPSGRAQAPGVGRNLGQLVGVPAAIFKSTDG